MKQIRSLVLREMLLASFLFALAITVVARQSTNLNPASSIPALESEMKTAVGQVEKLVNQPVLAYRRAPGMRVSEFKPGWFHEGASKPDFNNVDVRASQEKIYDAYDYVTSDLNSGIVFVGKQLEFNANLKYFYTNRSLPKKKLTEAEMLEINRLYRIIGHCESELVRLKNPQLGANAANNSEATGDAEPVGSLAGQIRARPLNVFFGAVLIALLLLILFFSFRRKRKG